MDAYRAWLSLAALMAAAFAFSAAMRSASASACSSFFFAASACFCAASSARAYTRNSNGLVLRSSGPRVSY